MKKVRQISSNENASAGELCGREGRGEAPRQLLNVDRAHLADQSDQQLNLGDIMLLWNISTYLAPPDGSALVLAELLHHLVAQLARDVDALRDWHHCAHLVEDWDRDIDEDDADVGERLCLLMFYHLSRHILTRLLWHQGALLPFHFFTIIF